jgi:hypothetical protein
MVFNGNIMAFGQFGLCSKLQLLKNGFLLFSLLVEMQLQNHYISAANDCSQ